MRRLVLLLAAGVLIAGAAGLWRWRGHWPWAPRPRPTFVAAAECFECHAVEHKLWQASHHMQAMAPATEQTVLGDFANATFSENGITARFFRKGGRFYVQTEGADGLPGEFEILYTFGVVPLQQYLIPMEGGRLQCLTIAWDTKGKRWFSLYGEKIAAGDPLHWTGRDQNWNFMCAECHSTDLRKNYDPAKGTYATTWSEISVGCQACHGPGSAHVRWAREKENDPAMGLAVRFPPLDPLVEIEGCARCHSRRGVVDGDYEHGARFLDHYDPSLALEPLYWPDGQIREEVYEYGSFLQSKMFLRGVRCSVCHDPHSARLKVEGNALCAQCHGLDPPERHPTLPKKIYDGREHHFHDPAKEGSRCVDCHMPARNFMVIDARRDHSFRVPRPDATGASPNACNSCHAERDAAWAAETLARWYPNSVRPLPQDDFHLSADRQQPPMSRAAALWRLSRTASKEARAALLRSIGDPDALVRAVAVRAMEPLLAREPALADALAPMLEDEIRLVRVEAAILLAGFRDRLRDEETRRRFEAALEEYRARQAANADRPESPYNLAILSERLGEPARAEALYRKAIAADPDFLPARVNLGNLLNALGRNDDAAWEFRTILDREPENGEAAYSLGLLLAEMGRLAEAVPLLEKAADLLPHRPRARYNLGLALQSQGRIEEAERALLLAYRGDDRDADTVHALALLYARAGRSEEAARFARRLVELR